MPLSIMALATIALALVHHGMRSQTLQPEMIAKASKDFSDKRDGK